MTVLEAAGIALFSFVGLVCVLLGIAWLALHCALDAKEIIEARCERLDIERARREEADAYRTALPLPPTELEAAEVLVHAESFTREAALR